MCSISLSNAIHDIMCIVESILANLSKFMKEKCCKIDLFGRYSKLRIIMHTKGLCNVHKRIGEFGGGNSGV